MEYLQEIRHISFKDMAAELIGQRETNAKNWFSMIYNNLTMTQVLM
jgi:hypothetical protein